MTRAHLVSLVVVGVIVWWLLKDDHKAVSGDVSLGDPTVVASNPQFQAAHDYLIRSDSSTSTTLGVDVP